MKVFFSLSMDDVKVGDKICKKKRRKARNNVSHLWTPTNGGWSNQYSAVTKEDKVSNQQQKYKQKIKRMAKRKTSKCNERLPEKNAFSNNDIFGESAENQAKNEENKGEQIEIEHKNAKERNDDMKESQNV